MNPDTPNGRQAVLGATVLALLVAGVAVTVVRKPSELALSLARGIAVVMIVGLAGIGLLFFVAANFESGISDKDQAEMLGLMLAALAVQVTISSPRDPWTGVGSPSRSVRRSTELSNSGLLGSCWS